CALRLSSCASSAVPVSGDAPNIWVTRSTDSTKSLASVRTWVAPDSSAENRRVTDSFIVGYFTHRMLMWPRVISSDVARRFPSPDVLDAMRQHRAPIRLLCAVISSIGVQELQLLQDGDLRAVRHADADRQ